MPRFSRKSRRRAGDDEDRIERLRTGFYVACCPFGHEDAMRAAWDELRDALLPTWIRAKPGTRPWAWWRFEGGRRETDNGRVHPFDDTKRKLFVAKSDIPEFWRQAYSLDFGMPACFIPPFDADLHRDFTANILCGKDSEIFEPEWSFLQRHALLSPEDSP